MKYTLSADMVGQTVTWRCTIELLKVSATTIKKTVAVDEEREACSVVRAKIKELLTTKKGSRKCYHLCSKNFGKCHFKNC